MRSPPCLPVWMLAALLLSGSAGSARAFSLDVDVPRVAGGRVWATVRLHEPLDARVERTLRRGAVATLSVRAELWRRRTGWFDRLERSADASLYLRYLSAKEVWTIDRPGGERVSVSSADSLAIALSRPLGLPIAPVTAIENGARYVVVVTVTLKPLSVKDLDEVNSWLRGEAREQSGAGAGLITTLPRSVFDMMRGVVGFGDRRSRGTSPEFAVGETDD